MEENVVQEQLKEQDSNAADIENKEQAEEQAAGTYEAKNEKLEIENQELKDKYLRLVAEFDNYRKRNAKERLELIQTAGKEVIIPLLEVMDDCDRAEKQLQAADSDSIREGVQLVFTKLKNTLQAKVCVR